MKARITRSALFILLLSCVLAISSCKKDEPSDIDTTGNGTTGALSAHSYLSGNLIEANFRGLIRDENGQALSDVEVRMGSSATHTDTDGLWQLLDVMVDSERAYIRAEKDGYFHGSRVLTPTDIGFNRAFITLMTAETTGSVSSSTGGEVSHSSGSLVSLPPDGYVDENGNAYAGIVNVQMCYLDPSNMDILEQMPGNLTALEADGDFKALLTYGMIGVELIGSGGESLQLATGANAEIHVPVPTEGIATASSSIPLWHFDEEEGVWKEDGSATLEGNIYVGEVSHFSFWNCDVPMDYVHIDGYTLGEDAAQPVLGVQIIIISADFGNGVAYSDQDGYFGGFIPGNQVLTMKTYLPCGDLLSSLEIGPFNSDVTVPVIEIPQDAFGVITGTLVNCGNEQADGYITAYNLGYLPESTEVDEEGNFNLTYGCAPLDLELIGYSSDHLTNSGTIPVTTIAGQSVDVGNINLCALSTDEYIVFTVLGETYTIVDSIFTDSDGAIIRIFGSQCELNDCITMNFYMYDNPAPIDLSFFDNNLFTVGQTVVGSLDNLDPEMDWNYSSYGVNIGDYLEFSFTATYEVTYSGGIDIDEEVTGYGRVQRDN